jgi:cytochrome P450
MSARLAKLDIISPQRYASGYPHAEWAELRAKAPVCRMEIDGYEPFVAVTKHADILQVSRSPEQFSNQDYMVIKRSTEEGAVGTRTLVGMDPPEHREYRGVASGRFGPRAIDAFDTRIREIALEIVGQLGEPGAEGRCDFVEQVAAWLPLRVISEMMGIPETDQARILEMTNQLLGAADAEYQVGGSELESQVLGMQNFMTYMLDLATDRKTCPRDDLATELAHGCVYGGPMPDFELLSYYLIMATAGHDTTRNAFSGGLLALAEHPDQLARLKCDRSLLPTAVDEMLRWTSPVVHFARTTVKDTELRGVPLHAGDRLALWYPSANHDEDEFEAPFEFQIDRQPNRHVAFGFGEHYCLGLALARLELRVALDVWLDHVDDFEVDGPVQYSAANFVGGVKHLPIRYRLGDRQLETTP